MTMHSESHLNALKKLVDLCSAIEKLLAADQEFFRHNNLQAITENNPQKAQCLQDLASLVDQIHANNQVALQNKSYLALLESQSHTSEHRLELQHLITQLNATLKKCQQHLAVNNQIAMANLAYLHKIWQKIAIIKNDSQCIYEMSSK